MKKKIIVAAFLIGTGVSPLLAQQKDSVITLEPVTIATEAKVPAEVDKSFKKAFPDAQNLKWYEMNKYYLAKFIQKDMKHRTLYRKNGSIQYDISYGTEVNLPENIRKAILETYTEFDIIRVANVKEAGRNIWVINLENPKHLVLVRVEEDEVEEVERYNKS